MNASELYRLLARGGPMTVKELRRLLGSSWKDDIKALRKAGLVGWNGQGYEAFGVPVEHQGRRYLGITT